MTRLVVAFACGLAVACSAPDGADETADDATSDGAGACIPEGYDRGWLDELKAKEFRLAEAGERSFLALGIVECLASPDPALRDGIAYEALAAMMRRGELTDEDLRALRDRLYDLLDAPDGEGFGAPFAALVLSEVARADRVGAWMEQEELDAMVARAAGYVSGVRDYRGFSAAEGWRHGVAHGADWLLQLSLNPRVGRDGLLAMRDAVGAQVSPAGHAYVFGESERLARVILYMSQRSEFSGADWAAWLAEVSGPGDELGDWDGVFFSEPGLVRRHNVKGFLAALFVGVGTVGDSASSPLLGGLGDAIAQVP